MGSHTWFRGDILNAIRAAEAASGSTCDALSPEPSEYGRGYRMGFQAALRGLSAAFGLEPTEGPSPGVVPLRRQEGGTWRA